MTSTPQRFRSRVVALRQLAPDAYELRLERQGLPFLAGQLITLHGRELVEDRSYTICSGERDDYLDVLFRLMPEGVLTPQLVRLQPGDPIDFSGAYGQFVLRDATRPIVCVATGTGVAPCRSFIRTHEDLAVTLLHGVRCEADLYYRDEFDPYHYEPCVSREAGKTSHQRVTDCLTRMTLPPDSHFYLSGSNAMIFDVHDLLLERGVDAADIFSEAYYYDSET